MLPIAFVILAVGAVGHAIFWAALVNRIHSLGIHRRWVDVLTVACGVMLCAMPIAVAADFTGIFHARSASLASFVSRALWFYIGLCAAVCVVAIVQRWLWHFHPERRGALLSNHTSMVRPATPGDALTAPGLPTWLSYVPGNDVLEVCVQEKQIAIPRLSTGAELLRIVHLTDLHMSGRIRAPTLNEFAKTSIRADQISLPLRATLSSANLAWTGFRRHWATFEHRAEFITCSETTTAT